MGQKKPGIEPKVWSYEILWLYSALTIMYSMIQNEPTPLKGSLLFFDVLYDELETEILK